MRTIFAEYNPKHNSIDVYTSVGYMLRIDCWEAEKDLKTTPGSDCALNALTIDEPLEYARLYLDGNLLDVSVSQSVYIRTFYRFFFCACLFRYISWSALSSRLRSVQSL